VLRRPHSSPPCVLALIFPLLAATLAAQSAGPDPLPSWNEGGSKKAITDFVGRVTRPGGTNFVPVAERIAVFDNDGTLWSEQVMSFQLLFALDRVRALAPKHREWKDNQPFKGVIKGDMKADHTFGNSDGDFLMLEWTTSGKGPRFALIVHHTDDKREWAYDRGSHIGKLERGLDEASKRGWVVVDMKQDWKVIHPFEK
jgi:hypothetical protein